MPGTLPVIASPAEWIELASSQEFVIQNKSTEKFVWLKSSSNKPLDSEKGESAFNIFPKESKSFNFTDRTFWIRASGLVNITCVVERGATTIFDYTFGPAFA